MSMWPSLVPQVLPSWAHESSEPAGLGSRKTTLQWTGGRKEQDTVNVDILVPLEAIVMMNNIRMVGGAVHVLPDRVNQSWGWKQQPYDLQTLAA